MELITPARFLSEAGATPKAWNRKMLDCDKLKILEYFGDSAKVFTQFDFKAHFFKTDVKSTSSRKEVNRLVAHYFSSSSSSVTSKSIPWALQKSSICFMAL